MMGGLDGADILRRSLEVAPNVAYFLPRNVDTAQVRALAAETGTAALELERTFLNRHEKALTAYFGFEEEEEEEEGGWEDGDEEGLAAAQPVAKPAQQLRQSRRGECDGHTDGERAGGAGLEADDPLFD